MAAWHAITHVRGPVKIEQIIQCTGGHGLRPGDSRYPSSCEQCDHNIDTVPKQNGRAELFSNKDK